MASPPTAPRSGPASRPRHTATGETARAAIKTPAKATPPEPSLGDLVSDASTRISDLVRGEIELAKLELRSSVKNAGVGIVAFVLAAAMALFSLVYGFQALAEGIAALGVPRWLAFLIVFLFQLVLAGMFAFVGYKKVKRVKAPEKTIKTTKETVSYFKSRG